MKTTKKKLVGLAIIVLSAAILLPVILTKARPVIEQLVWRRAKAANTIRSLRAYADAYPNGQFIVEAKAKQASLRVNYEPFSNAVHEGTENALKEFLAEFPGHAKEAEARRVLTEITEGRDIVDLMSEKKIEIQTQGSGIDSVSLRVRRLVSYPITLRIPVGTLFVAANPSSQNMVATDISEVRLSDDDWQSILPSTACANRPREIPSSSDTFSVERSPQQAELAKLMPVLAKASVGYGTRQAAVWIVSDNADYRDLGILVANTSGFGSFGGSRVIAEAEAAHAMMICDEAGIDITRKAIWGDAQPIYIALKDGDVKKWLGQKRRNAGGYFF